MMTKDELEKYFNLVTAGLIKTGSFTYSFGDFVTLYIMMFGRVPHVITIDREGTYLADDDTADRFQLARFSRLGTRKTMCNIYEHFKDTCHILRADSYPAIIGDHFMIFYDYEEYSITYLSDNEFLPDEISQLIYEVPAASEIPTFRYAMNNNGDIMDRALEIDRNLKVDLDASYNDDLPHQQITDFLNSEQSGLVLLFGNPGTGKTTYIRYLIANNPDTHFIVLDTSMFYMISNPNFIEYLLKYKNSAIILEDCEDMLTDRLNGNSQLATLLNLSDGLLADNFHLKFICTFNAKIGKLDKALLRKGRLKCQYEFKELSAEKSVALAKKLGIDNLPNKPHTISDIYNFHENTGYMEEKKMGFGH